MGVSKHRAETLLEEIGELYAIILRISRRIEEREALTVTQRLALIEIVAVGPLRLSNLASRMDTTPATATRAVDRLEEIGFVKRCVDVCDARAVLVAPTASGRRWSARRRELILASLREMPASAVSPHVIGDINRLNAALREVTGHDEVARGALLAP